MKLPKEWVDELICHIESHTLPVQLARVFRETLQLAGYSLQEIKQIVEDIQDEIEWQEISKGEKQHE